MSCLGAFVASTNDLGLGGASLAPVYPNNHFCSIAVEASRNIRGRNGPHSKAFSIMDHPTARQRAELLFQKRQEKALSEIQAKQEATRELTAKLRAERLKHEAMAEPKAQRKPKD